MALYEVIESVSPLDNILPCRVGLSESADCNMTRPCVTYTETHMLRLCTVVNQARLDPILAADVILDPFPTQFFLYIIPHYGSVLVSVKVNLLNGQKI